MGTVNKELVTFRKVGFIKGTTTGGHPSKTLVHLGIQNGIKTVILKQYALVNMEEEMTDWYPIKTFKKHVLYMYIIHIRLDTLIATAKIVFKDAYDVYRKIEVYMTRCPDCGRFMKRGLAFFGAHKCPSPKKVERQSGVIIIGMNEELLNEDLRVYFKDDNCEIIVSKARRSGLRELGDTLLEIKKAEGKLHSWSGPIQRRSRDSKLIPETGCVSWIHRASSHTICKCD